MSSDMVRDEVRSQLYAYLGGATATASGHEWDHERLRVFINSLMELPAMRGLMTAREATFRERYELQRTIERVRRLADVLEAESQADRLTGEDFDRGAAWGREDSAGRIHDALAEETA